MPLHVCTLVSGKGHPFADQIVKTQMLCGNSGCPVLSGPFTPSGTLVHSAHTGLVTRIQDSAADNAAVLAPHVGGAEVVTELYGYMNLLGIQGIGLVEATQRAPIIGHIIGVSHAVHDALCWPAGACPAFGQKRCVGIT